MLLRRKLEAGSQLVHQRQNTTRPRDRYDRRAKSGLRHFFNILCLEAFRTLRDCEFNAVAFFQGLVSVAHDGRVVDKHISAGSPLDETETLFVVKPLDLARLFTHYPQTPFL